MAINRNALNKVVFNGTVLPGCTPISPSSSWYDETIKCTPYDPTQAKQLVQQSGMSNQTVRLMVPTGSVALRQAQFVQAEEAAGRDQGDHRLDRLGDLAGQGQRRHLRCLPDRLVGPCRPGRQHLRVPRERRGH